MWRPGMPRRAPRQSKNGILSFLQVLARPSMASRAWRPLSLTVPPEILRLVTKARMAFSEALVLSGMSGRLSTRKSSCLRPSRRIEGRGQRVAVRRPPALAPIERRFGSQHQVLNDDFLVALVARAGRRLDRRRHRPVDRKLGDARTAPPLRRLALLPLRPDFRSIRRLVHPGRLERRTRRQMLQPRNLVLQRLVLNPLHRQSFAQLLVLRPQTPHLRNQIANQTEQLGRRHAFKRINRERRHTGLNQAVVNAPFPPGNLPRLPNGAATY